MGIFSLFHILLFLLGFLLFFFGLSVFRSNLAAIPHERLSKYLRQMTTTPLRGTIFGAVFTAAVQSSSAITLITIGLVDAGMLRFPQAVGIILGTNVGTCVTVQLLGLNLQNFALPCLAAGIILLFLGKKNTGAVLSGFGCAFIGLSLITRASSPIVYSDFFLQAVAAAEEQPIAGVMAGAVSTAIIQYSSIVMGILIALSQHETIGLKAAIPLILGLNLGTCVTAILGSIGSSRGAQQVAVSHLLLNFLGIIAALPLMDPFADLVSRTADSPGLQIANAHTIFNVLSSLAVLPFASQFTVLVKLICPDKRQR
ncbi:MAG TPA: Na/Pi cotransporter family protein [Clostridia bacterium]|jgi:phosphate:Na+ symporter|nr:Na/Pi cotransporter family protein [Clostridia bacterium]